MDENIRAFLSARYGLAVQAIDRMTTGVGGDTYRIRSAAGEFVFKIVKGSDINHPEREATLCNFLRRSGLPVSEFLPDVTGKLAGSWPDGRVCHLQRLIPGETFVPNTAPECSGGRWSEDRLAAYVRGYEALRPLSAADHAALMDVYLYQLLVCDYYAQYLHATPIDAAEFRQQADFATRVLKHALG